MKHYFTCFLLVTVFFSIPQTSYAAFDSATQPVDDTLRITRITPSGEDVPAGRQIVFQFDRPVVPVGRMDRKTEEIPVTITPALNCEWRWLNTSALACQLGEKDALKEATKYEITMQPGIITEKGVTLEEPVPHSFITIRPRVNYTTFKTWRAPGIPIIRTIFDQPVTKDSVEEHIFMLLTKTGDYKKIKAEPDPDDRSLPMILPLPGEKLDLHVLEQQKQKNDDQLQMVKGHESRRIWQISPLAELPLDSNVELTVESGLVSALGPETGTENRVIVTFDTFPELEFKGIRCYTKEHGWKFWKGNEWVLISASTPLEDQPKCYPLQSVALVFSTPVINEEVKNHVKFVPDLAGGRTDYDPWANQYQYSQLNRAHRYDTDYYVHFPELLKAYQEYQITLDSGLLKDEFGRPLDTPIDMRFMTAHRESDISLLHEKSVLEKGEETDAAFYVTNLADIDLQYTRLTASGKETGLSKQNKVPEETDVTFKFPLKVREMLDGRSGAVSGKFTPDPKVEYYSPEFFAQVTPFQVHVKLGHFNTLVWVTDMTTGKPVPDADITIYSDTYDNLSDSPANLAAGKSDARGIATLPGTMEIDPQLQYGWVYGFKQPRLFVRIDKDNDLALLPLDEDFKIDTSLVSQYEVYTSQQHHYGHFRTWGTTAQGVYKAGDTIQYKFYVRNQDNQTLVPAPRSAYTLEIVDPTDKVVHEIKDFDLSEFGAHSGEFTVTKNAAVGWYRFQLSSNFTKQKWTPMRVLVSDFTPSPFRVTNDLNGDLFKIGDTVEVATAAKLHAGGPYTDAQTRITTTLSSKPFVSQDPIAKTFYFETFKPGQPDTQVLHQLHDKVDDKGELTANFTIKDPGILFGRMMVESSVQDDRGKYVAGFSSADYVGRDRFVGLKQTSWLLKEDEKARLLYIVVNEKGKPVADVPVTITIERLETKASRVKGAGNAYLTKYIHEWIKVDSCQGKSGTEGADCTFVPDAPGSYRMTAVIEDTHKRPHTTTLQAYAAGKGRVLWEQPDDGSLQVIPEQKTYKVGDTARYLIKNPYPGATALISIERYGVIKQWVEQFDTSTPVVSFTVEPDFLPGFYLSVLVVSPRVDKPLDPDKVDLGKPAFRIGYVKVEVKDPYKEITVNIATDREVYKPQETVTVELHAVQKHKTTDEPIELAVAVLDEAVFDLITNGRGYFDPYNGFYHLNDLDLQNFSLLTRLVGRQKFEKKGADSGGDGAGSGADISLRSLFKFVSYWNPSIVTDKKGKATISFEVPDNLTGWRILALAATPSDRLGLGDANFKVNKPTELRPVMPNQVTEGDSFSAGFSVMNRTDTLRTLEVTVTAKGDIDSAAAPPFKKETIAVPPFKRQTIIFPVITKGPGKVVFTATAKDALDQDGLQHTVPVGKRRSLETGATYGTTTSAQAMESILYPKDIHTDVGALSVVTYPTVIGNLEGAFKYLRDYPYGCWEQLLTRGVMASHYQNLQGYIPVSFQWPESKKLPQQTLDDAANYQAPNGGMVFWIPLNKHVSPYLSAYTAIAFNWLRNSGYDVPTQVEEKLLDYLEQMLRTDTMPSFFSEGMSSTVRAVALAALAEHGRISQSDIRRYYPHAAQMSLFGKAHFLNAALKVGGNESMIKDVTGSILAHASQSGGKFQFNEPWDDGYLRILATPMRTNCAILSSFTALGETAAGGKMIGDIPFKLVRAITQTRGNRDHWENTQENLFCMNSLIDYSRIYEKEKSRMTIEAYLDDSRIGTTSFDDLRDPAVTFEKPIQPGDPGKKKEVKITKKGQGRLYYAARLSYALKEEKAARINAGIEIRREYSMERDGKWTILTSPMTLKRGDLVRIDLFVSLPTARHFVVVDDPIPGGLEPVNRDLATASIVDADKGSFQATGGSWWFHYNDWSEYGVSFWSFYHKELRHDAARFYADYLPPGNYHLSYTAQAIAPGEFVVMPVHSEEMYDPDVFGKGLSATLRVRDK
jgi:uncharacterized protein YfaS (alpha-2-macroglobulin family)